MTNRRGIELFARDYPHDYPEVEAILMLHAHRLRIHEVPVRMNARGFGAQLDRLPAQRLLHGQGAARAVRRPVPPPPDPDRGDRRGRARGRPARAGGLGAPAPARADPGRDRAAVRERRPPPRSGVQNENESGPGSLGQAILDAGARRHDRAPAPAPIPLTERRDAARPGQHDPRRRRGPTTVVPTGGGEAVDSSNVVNATIAEPLNREVATAARASRRRPRSSR